ncbi:MAG: hypothetical protein F6K36_10820 [Symploca sp. SIO3C6]|nr:hypothetical protein [Symploca sp. SIO3C6]
MARTPFAIGNPNGREVGPVLIPNNTEIAGIEVREQYGYGLIDTRLHFRNLDGSTIPGNPQTSWLTNNTNVSRTGAVLIPNDEVFIGLLVIEHHGYGIVNLRVKKRKRDGTIADYSEFLSPNMSSTGWYDVVIPNGAVAKGITGRDQGGYGLVDMAIDFEQ